MSGEDAIVGGRIKRVRLEKFENDSEGNPLRSQGPIEIWEGENEADMKLIYRREPDATD